MKGSSAPLTMAWELVSGLPVSIQPAWERLMYHMRMRGQMGGRKRWMEEREKEKGTGENNTCAKGESKYGYKSYMVYLLLYTQHCLCVTDVAFQQQHC